MATIKFYIKNSKSESSAIFLLLNYGAFEMVGKGEAVKKYLPFKYYINESINPKYWNKEKGRAKQSSAFRQYPEFNARIQTIEDTVLSVLRRLMNDGTTVTHALLKTRIDEVLKPGKSKGKNELMSFISEFIKISDKSAGTKKSYKRVLTDLREYETEKNKHLTFDRIDIDFHDSFVQYLLSKGYAPNTIGTRVKVLKTFMSAAYERGHHTNMDYQKKAFSKPKEETTSVYLNDEELSKLHALDLSNNTKLRNVRDWFLIAAYTGLRFSDFSRLTKEYIRDDMITIKTQKTGNEVVIPLHSIVRSILERHEYNLPKVISNQKFNEYIKEVCRYAKIDDTIMTERTKGNLKTTTAERKYNLVTAHTARRSFATNVFLSGVPAIQIMKLTGHKTEKAFLGYLKMTGKENAQKLQLHPFFNKLISK